MLTLYNAHLEFMLTLYNAHLEFMLTLYNAHLEFMLTLYNARLESWKVTGGSFSVTSVLDGYLNFCSIVL